MRACNTGQLGYFLVSTSYIQTSEIKRTRPKAIGAGDGNRTRVLSLRSRSPVKNSRALWLNHEGRVSQTRGRRVSPRKRILQGHILEDENMSCDLTGAEANSGWRTDATWSSFCAKLSQRTSSDWCGATVVVPSSLGFAGDPRTAGDEATLLCILSAREETRESSGVHTKR